MKRVSLLLRFALAVPIVCMLSVGLSAESSSTSTSSAPVAKQQKATKAKASTSKETPHHGTSSGSTKAESVSPAVMPPAPTAADEARSFPMVQAEATAPLGEYNGSVLDLPQIPAREMAELELLEPAPIARRVLMMAPNSNSLTLPAKTLAPALAPVTGVNFDGMSYTDNYCNGGQCGAGHPPDTTGAVGINHYIEGINMAFAIYDKSTGARLAAFTENSLWASVVGGGNCTSSPYGDPIVVYDQIADRWILTNFAFIVNSNGTTSGPYMQCMAVSKTGDPVNGGWYFYAVRMDQSPVPTNTLNDYPKYGNWNDGCLYMTANGFLNGSTFNGAIVASFSKSDMYSGQPVRLALGFLSGSANYATVPANALGKGSNLPSASTLEYLVTESATAYAFNVRTITAGSCTAPSSTITAAVVVPQASYGSVSSNIVPQPPPATTNNRLDSLGDRVMQWVHYRKVGSVESLWVQHTSRSTSTANTAPQWAQLGVTGGTIATTALQQNFWKPDTTLYRWMGSIAADNANNVLLAYSTSNATAPNYPSIKYTGRLAGDAANTMTVAETSIVDGLGSGVFNCGGAACHRWGDYSSMTVDPNDDCTFWYTNMYYNSQTNGSAGNHQTRIASVKFPQCTPIVPVLGIVKSHSGSFTQGQVGATYTISVTNNGPGYTFGTVSVTENPPAPYLVVTGISGAGWTCTLGTLTCTSTSNIAAGSSYPPITVTVNVASNAPASVTNSATVSGGGSSSSVTANDITAVNAATAVCGTVQLTTTASLVKLGNGSYQATVSIVNNGTGTAQNVKLTAATLGAASGSPIPVTVGNLVPGGGFAFTTETFPASAGTSGSSVAEKYSGTYTACPTSGTFGASMRATLP